MVTYPNKIQKKSTKAISYSNRGMVLEDMLNETNEYYLSEDIALIYKKPTPIGTVKVGFEGGHKVINRAYFKTQSTLDYNGIYKGRYIEFEAKETKNKTSFPLSNIHKHQLEHLKKVIEHGGIGFIIISMNEEVFVLPGEILINYIERELKKSLSYNFIKENAYKVKIAYRPRCDYLTVIDKVYFKEENI